MNTAGGSGRGSRSLHSAGPDRAHATRTVERCGIELRQAREQARRATEALRRALRGVEEAEVAFHEATQRLDGPVGPRVEVR